MTILERNPTPLLHNQGAGIVAGGDVLEFFEKYISSWRSIGVESQLRQHLDRNGNIVQRQHYRQSMTSWDLLYNLLRANFDGSGSIVSEASGKTPAKNEAVYQYGAKVMGFQDLADVMEVTYVDHEGASISKSADLVIAADGAGSKVREILTPDVTRRYAGYVAFRGTVPETKATQMCKDMFIDKFTFYTAPGMQILA